MRARALLLSMLLLAVAGPAGRANHRPDRGRRSGLGRHAGPGTALSIAEAGTGAERRLSTDQRGWYLAPGLAPGLYQIEVSHAGFRARSAAA